METTISFMNGEGSIGHNTRRFIADNVDASRTNNNITLIHEDIKQAYHKLFDKALNDNDDLCRGAWFVGEPDEGTWYKFWWRNEVRQYMWSCDRSTDGTRSIGNLRSSYCRRVPEKNERES